MGPRDPRLSIRLLGPLEISIADRPIVVDTRKAPAIVALVAAEGRPFARDELAAMFWPEADDPSARGALRRTLSTLRTAAGETGLVIDRAQVALDPDRSEVDLATFERLARSSKADDLEAAAALARGPFLAGFALRDSPGFDGWQAARAASVERAMVRVFGRLADARLGAGNPVGAIEAARRAVDLDPLDEAAQRHLIELLARTGDRSRAIRQYRELVGLFDRELGVAPLRDTAKLYEAVREGRLDAEPASFVPDASAAASPPHSASSVAPLVGRAAEIEALVTAWSGSSPNGRVAMLEGEAGIGKTRLAEALVETVSAKGGVVLSARGYPGESAIPYGPIAALLRSGLSVPGAATRLAGLDDIARLELERLVDLPAPLRGTGVPGPDGASARVRLLDAIAEAVTAVASGAVPGLVWIDDLHLVDDPTREALGYLAHRLTGRSLLVLVAWRTEDLTTAGHASAAELARLPGAVRLPLARLTRDEVGAVVRALRPDPPVDDALVDALSADSEGLPLHIVAALAGNGAVGALPHGVQAVLRERIGSVGEAASQILSAAAVIGRSFDPSIVRETSGRSEEEVVDGIEELIRRGIVREVWGGPDPSGRYDFTHARLREVALEATSFARRRLLHRRAADAMRLDRPGTGREESLRFGLIAAHERAAGREREAIAAFLEAAAQAEAVFASREAVDHLQAALALGTVGAGTVHARIGELLARLGEYPAAVTALETAAALAEPADLPSTELALGRVHRRRGDLVAAASHVSAALASATLTDDLRARALVERCVVALRAGDLGLAGTAATQARVVAGRVGDPHLAGLAERLVGLVAQASGDRAAARDALERSAELAADDPDPTASIAAHTALALTLAADGSIDAALARAAIAIESCRRIGDRHLEAAVENHVADLLHEAGRVVESMEHLKHAVALFAEIGEGAQEREPGIWTLAAW